MFHGQYLRKQSPIRISGAYFFFVLDKAAKSDPANLDSTDISSENWRSQAVLFFLEVSTLQFQNF